MPIEGTNPDPTCMAQGCLLMCRREGSRRLEVACEAGKGLTCCIQALVERAGLHAGV